MSDQKQPETMLEYVKRKVRNPAYNCSRIAADLKMRRATLSEIGNGTISDPQHSTVERLHAYFKSLAD